MYVFANAEKIVRWYAIALDHKSFELLDRLDLNRIMSFHDKASAKSAAQAIGLKTWRCTKLS